LIASRRGSRDKTALQAGVSADHGILHRVGDEQDHHKVERGQLPQLDRDDRAISADGEGGDERPFDDGEGVGRRMARSLKVPGSPSAPSTVAGSSADP